MKTNIRSKKHCDSTQFILNRLKVRFRWPVCTNDDTVARQRATPLPLHTCIGAHAMDAAADTRDYVYTTAPRSYRLYLGVGTRQKRKSHDGIRGEIIDFQHRSAGFVLGPFLVRRTNSTTRSVPSLKEIFRRRSSLGP